MLTQVANKITADAGIRKNPMSFKASAGTERQRRRKH